MIDDEAIATAYRLLLDREPEGDIVVAEKRNMRSVDDLIVELVSSKEFMARNRDWLRSILGD